MEKPADTLPGCVCRHPTGIKKKHETGFEPATLALARRYSTTEPLVQTICASLRMHLLYYTNIIEMSRKKSKIFLKIL